MIDYYLRVVENCILSFGDSKFFFFIIIFRFDVEIRD